MLPQAKQIDRDNYIRSAEAMVDKIIFKKRIWKIVLVRRDHINTKLKKTISQLSVKKITLFFTLPREDT